MNFKKRKKGSLKNSVERNFPSKSLNFALKRLDIDKAIQMMRLVDP